MDVVSYVDGVCGSYKTTRCLTWAGKFARLDNRIIIACPSIILIDEVFKKARDQFPEIDIRRFDSTVCPNRVFAELQSYMKEDRDTGAIMFISHKCLFDNPWWSNQDRWHVVIDEIPNVTAEYVWNLTEQLTAGLVAGPFDAVECGHNNYLRLVIRPDFKARTERWARNPDSDTVIRWAEAGGYANLCNDLLNPHTDVYVARQTWNDLNIHGKGQFHAHSLRKPSILNGWAGVQIMGACFDQSVLRMAWGALGVTFKPSTQIKAAATTHDATAARRLHVKYFTDRKWSKHLLGKLSDTGHADAAAIAKLFPVISDEFGDAPFLVVKNNDIPDTAITQAFPNAKVIPNNPHGLNQYVGYTKVAFLSALNHRTPHYRFLHDIFGIDGDDVAQAHYYQTAYQGVMRSALRDPNSTEPVDFIVPPLDAANWFAAMFPGCKVIGLTHLDSILGDARQARGRPRKQVVKSQAERDTAYRAKREQLRTTKNTCKGWYFSSRNFSQEAAAFSEEVHLNALPSWDAFRDQLRDLSETFCPKKEEATLISGAEFAPQAGVETVKGIANVVLMNGIWFDVDNGVMQPRDWFRIFPHLKFMCHNSFNNGLEGKLKYRVIFPSRHPVGAEQYHAIWDAMVARIEAAGFYVRRKTDYDEHVDRGGLRKFSGIDKSKRTANSFFYLPARAGLGKKHTFWLDNWGDATGVLDPEQWLTYLPRPKAEYVTVPAYRNPGSGALESLRSALRDQTDDSPVDPMQKKIDAAIRDWQNTCEGERYGAFYRFGARLFAAGMSRLDVIGKMQTVNPLTPYPPDERRRRIKEVMKSLGK